jgi:uncharacterized membrane protein HdeD (DUF308 family)
MANTMREADNIVNSVRTVREDLIRERRGWYVAQGILFIVVGLLAFVLPAATVLGVEIFLAALLLVSGAYQTYHGFTEKSGWMIFSGVLSLLLGIFLVAMPAVGVVALATAIAVFLFVEGVVEIILALQMRFSRRWGWLLASGILSIVLSVLLLIGWPQQTVILAGIFLGVNFILYGASVLAVAASVNKAQDRGYS